MRVARWNSETSMLRIEGPQGWCLSPRAAILSRRGFHTSGPHRDRLGVYPRSAPVAPIGSILQPLPDNRQELTWCPPLITDAIRLSATGDQRFVVLFSAG